MSTFNYFLKSKESISTFQERSLRNDDDEQHSGCRCQCERGQTSPSEDRRHHNIRLRKLILATLLVLSTLGGLLVWSCVNWHGRSTWEVDSLVGRGFFEDHVEVPLIYAFTLFVIVGIVVMLMIRYMGGQHEAKPPASEKPIPAIPSPPPPAQTHWSR